MRSGGGSDFAGPRRFPIDNLVKLRCKPVDNVIISSDGGRLGLHAASVHRARGQGRSAPAGLMDEEKL